MLGTRRPQLGMLLPTIQGLRYGIFDYWISGANRTLLLLEKIWPEREAFVLYTGRQTGQQISIFRRFGSWRQNSYFSSTGCESCLHRRRYGLMD